MASTEVRWCVEERDTGMPCASGSATTEEEASREMMHYALQYGQDGPVRYWMRQNRKTLVKGEIAGVSVTMRRTDGDSYEAQTLPAVAGQVEFGVRPDVPEVNFGDMPMGAVYTPSLGSVGAAMYTYTAGQMIQYAARKAREARDAERERCAQLCEQEICACCWDDDAQAAAAEHLAAEIRKGPTYPLAPPGTKC